MFGFSYLIGTTGPKIDAFLRSISKNGGVKVQWVIEAAQAIHPDFENPDAIKPGSLMPAMKLNDPDLDAVAAYLETLR